MVHQRSRISSGRKRRFNHAWRPILNQSKLARYQNRSQLNWSQKSHRWFKEERCLRPSSMPRSEILFLMLPNKHSGDDTPWEKYIPMCVKASNIRISTPLRPSPTFLYNGGSRFIWRLIWRIALITKMISSKIAKKVLWCFFHFDQLHFSKFL